MLTQTELLTLPDTANQHDHQYHQLVFGLEGSTEFDIQGLGEHVGLGRGCLVPSTTDHAFCGIGDNRIVVINVPSTSHEDQAMQDQVSYLFDSASYFKLDSQRMVLLQSISQEMANSPIESPLRNACGYALLLSVQNLLKTPKPKRNYLHLDIDAIDQYIELNLHRKLSIAELAAVVHLSPSHFHTRFKEATEHTPHQYVLKKRLIRAKDTLAKGWSVMKTADECGFSSQSAFTHAFREHFGTTPAKCRKQNIEL